ncbi:MAG TPA: hypothetical protein VJ874_02560, partial [Candidatus Thermoplasmatota archaeon]|nr:hypothetical protein [Candidatus Thermoplasmatota archaeon]
MRAATVEEEQAILGSFEAMETGLAPRVVGRHALAVVERDGIPFAALVTPEMLALPEELRADA